MSHRSKLVGALLGSVCGLLACGGGASPSTAAPPASSAEQAVKSFMQAAADSNLAKMASLWGTRQGAAAVTGQPPDYERRVAIMQVYLAGAPYHVLSGGPMHVESAPPGDAAEQPADSAETHQVVVQLERPGCPKFVPFTVVRTDANRWVVNDVDLAAAGNPRHPCNEKAPADSAS
ncbi:MAG TPA: hypothetical protein VFW66_14985 [Gemmatimonadales bacterium]|nr:hypothetical protein [Gemmatimonadales bacterium]